jgi:hypothetical protein
MKRRADYRIVQRWGSYCVQTRRGRIAATLKIREDAKEYLNSKEFIGKKRR